jgi:hypothetical protein
MYIQNFLAALVLSSVLVFAGCSSPAADSRPQPKPAPSSQDESLGPKETQEPATAVKEPQTTLQPPSTAPAKKVSKAPTAAKTRSAAKPPDAPNAETIAAVAPPAPIQPPLESTPAAESTPAVPEPKLTAPEPIARQITVPSGTLISVRMIDSVDSESGHVGQTFKASLDAPITVDNETVFPKGAEAYVKLTKVQSAGNLKGKSELQLQLDRIFLGRKSYTIETNTYDTSGAAQGAKTARTAVIGAAIGTAIGAITGGGKGAVIGGATGAGAGVGIEAVTKGEQVRVDSETRLDFRLEQPLEVTAQSASPIDSSHPRDSHSGPLRFGTRPD